MEKDLTNREVQAFNDAIVLRKEIQGLEKQRGDLKRAVIEVSKLLKKYKDNSAMTMQVIVGGNLIRRLSNKEVVETLDDRRKQTENALSSVEEQISHRIDELNENYLRLFYAFKRIVPKELFDDEDN